MTTYQQKYELALAAAHEMAARHARGDYNYAQDIETLNDIDCWVGFWESTPKGEKMRWPRAICAAAGFTQGDKTNRWPENPQ